MEYFVHAIYIQNSDPLISHTHTHVVYLVVQPVLARIHNHTPAHRSRAKSVSNRRNERIIIIIGNTEHHHPRQIVVLSPSRRRKFHRNEANAIRHSFEFKVARESISWRARCTLVSLLLNCILCTFFFSSLFFFLFFRCQKEKWRRHSTSSSLTYMVSTAVQILRRTIVAQPDALIPFRKFHIFMCTHITSHHIHADCARSGRLAIIPERTE